jgi:hypothetical protein
LKGLAALATDAVKLPDELVENTILVELGKLHANTLGRASSRTASLISNAISTLR